MTKAKMIEQHAMLEVVHFDVDEEKLKREYLTIKDLIPTDTASLNKLKKGIANFRDMRKLVTDRHKELKAPVLERAQEIDGKKNTLIDLIKQYETPLIKRKNDYEAQKEREKQEKARIEQERINKIRLRISTFANALMSVHSKTSEQIKNDLDFLSACATQDFDYMEFNDEAQRTIDNALTSLQAAFAEKQKFEIEKAEFEKEKERLRQEKAAQQELQAETGLQNTTAFVGSDSFKAPVTGGYVKTFNDGIKLQEEIVEAPIDRALDDDEQRIIVCENMMKYGGSFVSALGKALSHADKFNSNRIKNAFPEYWAQYSNFIK